jgi:hypothetical protein
MRTTQMIARAATRSVSPIRVAAAPTDRALRLLRSKYHPPILSNSKPQPARTSNSVMEVHCIVERLARAYDTKLL